jgi:diguanylate cyclase (GGDEF)-like protein
VLLPNSSGDDAMHVARRILDDVRSLGIPHAETSHGIVTLSLGVVSLTPSKLCVPEDLVRQADLALYRAKDAGRNCVKFSTA